MEDYNILVINPGSTSTKISFFKNEEELFSENINHSKEDLKKFHGLFDQYEYRLGFVENFIKAKDINTSHIDIVMAIGGLTKPISAGTYEVSEDMIADLRDNALERWGLEHPSNLGAPIALGIARKFNIKACISDPVTVDELEDIARISGIPEVEKKSTFHALNLRAVGKKISKDFLHKSFEKVNLIGIHMGGGISVVAFKKGKAVEVNRGAMGYGPFSPQRAGTMALIDVMELCFSGKYTKKDLIKKFMKESGLTGYLGTDDGLEIERRIKNGDKKAKLIYKAMIYQTCKEAGAMAAVLKGHVDGVYITGGLANSEMIREMAEEMLGFIGKFFVYPSQSEMHALATAGLKILKGEEKALKY